MRIVIVAPLLATGALAVFCGAGAAQRWTPAIATRTSPVVTLDALPQQQSSNVAARLLPKAPDYRYEGALIGGAAVGTSFAVLAHVLCEGSDTSSKHCTWSSVKAGGLGLITGGLLGALIGGMLPKERPRESPD